MNAVEYACLGGNELGSINRVLSYLWRRLGDARITVGTNADCVAALGSGYSDTYSDLYSGDPYWPGCLECWCAGIEEDPGSAAYVSPADDPAPWYVASNAASEDFLGFIPWTVVLQPVASRRVNPRGQGGAVVGALHRNGRVLSVRGTMYAATADGMAYGERWLADVLAGTGCGPCGLDDLAFLPSCPEDGDGSTAIRYLREVGVLDGPIFTATAQGVPDCVMQDASFEVSSQHPYLFSEPVTVDSGELLDEDTVCALVEAPEWAGDVAVRVTITAGGSGQLAGVRITAHRTEGDVCPVTHPTATPCVDYEVMLNAGQQLVLDSSVSKAQVWSVSSGQVVGGLDALTFTGLPEWIVVPPCQQMCICIDTTGATLPAESSFLIESIAREV